MELASTLYQSPYYEVAICATRCPLNLAETASLAEYMRETLEAHNLPGHFQARVRGPVLSHHRFKVALAGCPNACSEPQIKDFAVIAAVELATAPELCTGCGACLKACREGALGVEEEGPRLDLERCLGCGLCARACATGALTVARAGYRVLVGGKLGRHPQLAQTWLTFADAATVRRAFVAALELWLAESHGERLGEILNRTGLAPLQARLDQGVL